ncbi:beta-1,3-glucan-binding protein [Plakobranchus ocellatus]|uniref:Beta-1,3-glucan-binding protein n=1 Tax=Plakobranchus ocellatus TaxID=259542 RepID=A0AAV4CEL5_9GAST|nr:beta-1,3-glucan-binding protein [Plakobranchus ocellatus]
MLAYANPTPTTNAINSVCFTVYQPAICCWMVSHAQSTDGADVRETALRPAVTFSSQPKQGALRACQPTGYQEL